MPSLLETKADELNVKRKALADIFEAKKAPEGRYNLTPEEVGDVKAKNDELTALGKEYESLRELDYIERKNREGIDELNAPRLPGRMPGGDGASTRGDVRPQYKSIGERITESPEFKAVERHMKEGGQFKAFSHTIPDFNTKTTMTETVAGYAPPNYRTGIVILSAQRRPVVADLIPQDETNLQLVKYMEETTFTNNAAMTAEAAAAGESALAYTERSVLVEWLPAILPVSEQQLEDVKELMSIINNRLALMIGQSEEIQLLSGNGTSPQLNGFLSKSGVQTQAQGADPVPDAIMKAMTLVRFTGFADPTGMVIHPTNWQTIRLLRSTTGQYIWGSPSEVGPERVWGMPAVVTPAITSGTALLGDFMMYSHISRRLGLRVEVGYINDNFSKGLKTIRAQERLSLEIYRPAAFCTVTGLV